MSTTEPTGEGGGGGEGESATMTNVEQTPSPSTPITGTSVSMQAATQQQQQPQQHPPPSPLSGCYLLVVLPEPHTAQHKDLILNRLAKGFLSWDKDSCHVDLEKELLALVAQAPEGEEARNGERLIQYATENLVTEVLIHPQTNTLLQCIRNLLASFTKHRHIIHAGYTFGGNGSWILQDGTFSLADFLDAFSEHEVQRVLRAYENSVTVDIHCAGVGDWTTSRLSKETCCRSCRVRVNPDDVLTAGVPAIMSFTNYIGQYLVSQTLDQLMEPSDVVGNIRFSHPTLYVFPGGQGDAALFGINGFNMLVDGGFARKACFWDFTRHLDRLDAVLVTRINNSNIGGMFSVLRKKKEMHVYPQIGHFFCNLVERRQSNSPDGDKDIDPLIFNLTDIGQEMVVNLRHINLRAHPCYRDPDPINLYHKVGHGTLDMYVLSPSKDSREVREFLAKWHTSDSKLFAGSHKKDSNNLTFPMQNLVSICALLVWQPANPEDNITRILFPGSTPQHKIFEGFERLKHLDFLKHPVCSAKTLSPSVSLATLRDKSTKQKLSLIEKEPKKILETKKEKREPSEPKSIKAADETVSKSIPQSTPIIPANKPKTEMKTKKVVENKKIETETKESKKIEKELKEVKKEPKKESIKVEKAEKREEDVKKTDLIKPEPEKIKEPKESKESKEPKEPKPKPEPKKKEPKESKMKVELKKSEVTPKPKLIEKKAKSSGAEKRDAVKSSPTTPKKTLNGAATKTEISKAIPKVKPAVKVAPSLPAKSAKEANNRKVVEQKKSEVEKSAVKDSAAPVVKVTAKPKPMDRKPISRRAKPVSPNKARMPGSPAKSTRSTPTASVKSDKDGVIRKVKGDKGTTDSSTVSTPSGIEPEVIKPIDKSLIEQSEDISLDSIESKVLADLKEEREVVEEIEAVLQKAERIEEIRKDDRFEGDDEITAEATDKKEEDITEEDVTAEIEDIPKKEGSRKESQELTEEDEYLIVEKEEVYTEDSAQSGEGEQKHVLDEAQSEKAKILKDVEAMKEKGEKEEPEEKEKDDSPEKKIEKILDKEEKEIAELSSEHKEQLQEEVKEIIASAAEIVQKAEEKDDSGKKDSEDITKEPSSLSPDKLDSSEKKTTDTDIKPDVDQKENILEKMEESQERISTIESGATTTAPTLPEDERIPLDEIKEDIDEKHVIEEVKEKDASAKLKKEVIPETIIVAAKPEVKVFDVRQAMPNLQRDIVKTPDEVADLPVHEEVDPKLYRMEDFEKGKEEKLSPTAQEDKESPIPPAKEQKSVFSFFGKVADKFEKGIDKLTKKKKDSEKDSDEKSSKSSSPKEPKVQEKTVLEEVDMEKVFPKIGKPVDKPETFEEAKPTTVDIKVAAIKETAAFIQEEILDVQRKSVPDIEEKLFTDKLDEIKKIEAKIEESFLTKDVSPGVSPTKLIEDKEIAKEIELLKEEDIGEDVEEVKALLEEASKKFKTVKDSLRDSLESLEDKIKEEIVEIHETPSALKDIVKDTLEGVAEKLEEIKPHIESHLPDIKEPEKVKFAIPKDEEFEEEYEEEIEGPYRDMKEAVRDVGEVLAGTAGIELEDKPKDVIEIVKKVAEVLREDDFLSDKALFEQTPKKEEISPISTERKPSKEEISPILTERKPSISSEKISPEIVAKLEEEELKLVHEDIVMPKKVDVTEVFPVHKELEKFEKPDKLPYEKPGVLEVKEEPCVKVVKEKDDIITSPIKDIAKDKRDAQKICEEILKDDQDICDQHKKPTDDDTSRVDVMQAGIEDVCVKEVAKRPSFEKKLEDEIEESMIVFEQKISPAKAEIVMVTPGSTPTSPKFVTDKIYDEGLEIGYRELPEDIKQILSKEVPIEEIIEELVITKKKKVTIEVIEYVTVTKRIPRERVIYIIEEIITKKGLLRENVIDDSEILRLKESITLEKRMEIEEYILNEYIVKGKRITIEIVQEISIKKVVPKKIIIEIIEEIIVKRKLARHMVLNVPEEALSEIIQEKSPEESPEQSAEEQITEEQKIDIPAKQEFAAEVSDAPTGKEKLTDEGAFKPYIEEFIVNEYVIKGKKITASTIDDISIQKTVPKQILIEIIEEIIIKKKIPRNTILDVTEKELLVIFKKIFEDEKEKLVAETTIPEIPETESIISQERAEVEEYIINEYVTKGDNINIKKLEEICGKKKVPKKIIIEIIEEIIIKKKIPRHIILSVTDEELSHIIKEEAIPESQILTEKPVAEMPSIEEKKSPIELKKDKKEDVLEQEMSAEEELLATSEEEDIEKEVDGFVSIPRRISDTVDIKKAISQIPSSVTKEHEKDVIDDFEAVEQEYKVRDVQSPEKASEMKEKEDIEESVEDTTSEVIEADEKFVQETKGKVGIEELHIAKDIKPIDEKREPVEQEISEISEIVDTTEKYLDEAKEKTDDILQKETATTLTPSISEKAEKPSIEDSSKETPKDFSDKQPSIDAPDISKSIIPSPKIIDEKLEMKEIEPAIKEEVEELQLKKVAKEVKAETKLADATGFTQEPKVELLEDDKKSKPLETTEIKETPIIKEEKSPQETLAANIPKPFDDGTVKRMLVTACSEDGREEIEICPSGSITFTKTVTPDDSLKDVSAKSTPDKDSLLLDKDSRSDISTPEKDSISEKSAPEGKDKITPEDSLEKSPAGPRDSQDLEDSLEKSELHKPKVPEELEDITKSPMEKDLKVSDKIAEKDIPKSPKEEQVEPKSPTKEDEKIEKMKSPAEEKIEKSSSPIEKIEKSRSPSSLDTTTQKSLIELAEKSKLPIEKVPEPKKKETIGVSKTPESLHSEDVSPAETIFSKSPTDKSEMYFAKAPVTEEDVAIEKDIKKLPESIKEIKTEDKELPISLEKSDQDIKSLDKSPTILSDKVDEKENYKLKSPSIMEKETVSEKLPIFESEYYDEKGPIDESPSAISDKSDEKKEAERSKSPSIAVDKPDLQDVTERYLEKPKSPIFDRSDSPKAIDKTEESHDKDRSPSVASDKSDSKKISDRSRSPSVSIEKVDFERTRSSSVTSVKDDKLEQFPVAKSPEISKDVLKSSKLEEDKSDLKDIIQPLLDKSPSVTNGISESKEPDRSKSPIIAGEKPEMKDMTETPVEKSRSPSVISVTSEQKEPIDRSKSPSIAEEKIDLKDVAEPADRSKSPSVIREKPDLKDVIAEKSRSFSITGEQKESLDHSKSPSIAGEKPDLKDVTAEKSRSSSITEEQKESLDRSKSPSIAGEKLDLKDVIELSDEKSKSGASMSVTTDSKGLDDRSKSPSSTDLTDITEQSSLDKSKSPSVTSITSDQKESTEKAKSPIPDKKEELDRSKSPSITSEKSDEKKSVDGSKATSVTEEKPDLKDVMELPGDKSRSSSVASEKELFEKSTSPVSDKLEPPVDRSKSPSIASDKSDEKTSDDKGSVKEHYESAGDKSPNFVDVKIPHEKAMEEKPSTISGKMDVKPDDIISHDRPVSPSIVFDKPIDDKQSIEKIDVDGLKTSDIIDDSDFVDKTRSLSIISDKTEPKSTFDVSKSPSLIDDQKDKSRSSSVASERLDDIKISQILEAKEEQSISPSLADDQKDKSRSSSVASERLDDIKVSQIPEAKRELSISPSSADDQKDKSKSSSERFDDIKVSQIPEVMGEQLISPSSTDDQKDKSRSSSVASERLDDIKVSQIPEAKGERSISPSSVDDQKDKSKSSSEKLDDIKASQIPEEKEEQSISPSSADDQKDKSKSSSERVDDIKVSQIPEAKGEQSISPSSIDDQKEKSRSSSVASERIDDIKVPQIPEAKGEQSISPSSIDDQKDKSRSSSVASEKLDDIKVSQIPEAKGEQSISPSSIDDQKDKSRSSSVASEKLDDIKVSQIPEAMRERSISPSLTDDQKDKSKSSSERVDDIKVSQIPEAKGEQSISPSSIDDQKDKSRSSSVASERVDDIKVSQIPEAKGEQSISPSSIDGQKDKSRSSSVASERLDDIKVSQIPEAKIEQLISPSSADDQKDKSRSSSVASERLDNIKISQVPEAKGERSISPSSADDQKDKAKSSSERFDDIKVSQISEVKAEQLISPSSTDGQKDKSRSSSVASERFDDIKVSQIPEAKGEQSISPSLDTGKIPKDESAKSSRASSPVDKTPKDRSRSQSVFDAGEKTPTRSRTASLFDDKLSEKPFQEEKHFDMGKPLDEKVECKKDSKSPITSPETIEKKMQKIREKRFADFKEPDIGQPSKVEKSDDEEEDVIKVTAEKKAEIEKYIIDEFIVRKRKISLTVIERLVMTYSVPQFIVMEIIEDIINRQNIPRSAVFDFVDDKASSEPQYGKESETELLAPQERAKVEEYIIEEFIMKKKKITPEVLEEMVIVKSVPRYILITIIEEIIVKKKILRNTIIEGDLGESGEKDLDISEKREEPVTSASVDFGKVTQDVTQEDIHSHEKSGDTTKESLDGKISPAGSDRYGRDSKAALSASPSLSPEPIPSDKSTQDSPARSEPHIDEEILISEEKRMEIEKLLEEEYIKKGKKITEVILEEIIIMTSLPRYIILEIVEEIILKRKIPRESVIDVEIYQEEEPEDYDKAMYHYEGTTDVDYELPHARDMYPESGEQQLDKSDYPSDYESQFHKAFVGGMTEMRTTHITTLSGKSTPEFTHDTASKIESTDKVPEKLSESTLTTTHITRTDVEDTKAVQSAQTITILRESKITETVDKDKSEESAGISATVTSGHAAESDGDVIVSKTTIKHEVIKEEESGKTTEVMKGIEPPGFGPQEIVKEIEQSSIQQDEPEAITKIIKEEIMEHDEPEVVTKVVKREIIEQDEPEIITKVIRREIVIPDEEISDSKEDSGEYMKTITTKKTTRTIVTEELADAELAQADPSKIHTDPTSDSTYKAVSDEGDAASADIKRIVTTVTTITGPDGKVTTKTDVKESTDTLAGEEVLEKLTETTKSAEKIIKETITTVTSGTTTPDVKAFYSDSGKSTPDLKHEAKLESTIKERLDADKFEHPVSPLIRELISDDKSYSGKSSPDISLPKDIVFSGKSTPEVPTSPLIRDGAVVQPHVSGRSTPDKRSDCRSSTSTPEGFRSGEMIRTIVTTTKTVSDEGEIVTTTREVTETTNEKGETVVLAEKTDVKVDERLPSKDAAESAISSIIGSIKSSELQRGDSPGSDDIIGEKDHAPVSPSSEYSSTRSKVMTHPWGSSEERHTYSDDEPPSSSLSSTSQVGYSPQITHHYESSSDKQEEQKQVEFSVAAMSSSFYGELPAVPPQISAMKTFHGETGMQKSSDPIHSRFTVEKEPAGDYGEKLDAKRYVDEADLDFDKALMDKEMKEIGGTFSSGIAPRYTNGNLRHEATDEKDHPSSSFRDDKDDSKGDSKKDPLEGWGTPLGLPSPKPPKKFNLKNSAQFPSCSSETTSDTLNFDVVKNWGEPLRLPSPAPVTNEISNKGAPSTPKKERKQAKKIQSENIKNKKRSESPGKNEKKIKDSKNKVQPVYMDLAYVPHHGNSYYTSLEFFKRVRARYYVFSGTEPSREVYDALLEAKKTWEDKDLEVTMIPTYDTDTLGYWVADNEEALAANHIDLSPSASRCTINLQDHETSCSAYRLEF
ncbi:PREDICTED: microtubule-associated protein futsch isoform X2 [Atta colombica]|uniref:microtubule-associated protein futsch isoform X2 n=1 Tax=Atta colombica TaxID=520822 RepID=UPI00084CCDA8|nr:PREDICTED: microtubule-associated protein futsch isoform X2 [Atta colombica]